MLPLVYALGCAGPPMPSAEAAEAATLTPLAAYRAEVVAGVSVLWSPAWAGRRDDLQERVRAALAADLAALDPAMQGLRVAVAPGTPAVVGLPSGGRGIGLHRSARWLVAMGFDAAREGVVEIYDGEDYLARRREKPAVLATLLAEARAIVDEAATPGECDPDAGVILPLPAYAEDAHGPLRLLWHPAFDLDPALRGEVRAALVSDWAAIVGAVPTAAIERLGGTVIVVNVTSFDLDGDRKRGLAVHRSARWLVENGYDAAREGAVEVHDARDYLRLRATAQPWVLLHELTHVQEQRADPATLGALDGAWTAAKASGRYDAVAHVDGAPGETRRAYALESPNEYGAELAEARFGRNDFAPFDHAELGAFDPLGCEAASALWLARCLGD